MASIRLQGVRKQFLGGHIAVDRMDLTIEDGELFVLVGPSGCGKSTVLRLLAGLDAPDDGRIFIGDRDVTGDRPQDRDVAMVFQDYALYPHKTVRENLAFGLRMRGAAQAHILAKVQEVAALLDIGELLERRPRQLSGGQRQRVALGRAIARDAPRLLAGRTAVQPGRQAAGANAHRAGQPAAPAGHHHGLRHPRPGGGHDPG